MKKLYVALLSIFFVTSVNANCPFTDRFTVSALNSTKILNAKTASNVHYEKISDTVFSLSCADSSSKDSGYLYIDVGYNSGNKCSLVIHDGPQKTEATLTTVICNDKISFAGMNHGFASHDYTLLFVD